MLYVGRVLFFRPGAASDRVRLKADATTTVVDAGESKEQDPPYVRLFTFFDTTFR